MSSESKYHCKIHNKKYVGYCESCNLDICLLCTSKHEKHDLLQYNEIQPSSKKISDLKQNFIEYKKNNNILISKISLWLEKINHYSNKIIQILENNEKIYENIFSNYDENNLIFAEIDNMNQIRKKGLILGYKNINLNLFENDDKILEKSDLIFKTIKEMQIEDIFFSIKGEKNSVEIQPKEKKLNKNKKMKNKEINNIKKENEDELLSKRFEDYKEINLKSNYFDSEYLINLENSKKNIEEIINDRNANKTDSLNIKTLNTGREINNLTLIQSDKKKYIVTSSYCYINLYDLKGQLQRSIKLHDSDITNLIQLKNLDIASCCIDGTIKIIQLGKNEGYNVIQKIDTKEIKQENKNSIFSNNQLYVLGQLLPNEDIVTAHGDNLIFYSKAKNDLYDFSQLLPINEEKKENDYDFIINNNNICSLLYINNNNNLIALNNNTIFFIEKNQDKYYLSNKIKDICGNGGPNNICLLNNDIIIFSGGNKIYFVNVKEKCIINEINTDFSFINCINIRTKSDLIYIGYENKNSQYDIGEYKLNQKENKYDLNNIKIYNNVHTKSISNILPIDREDIQEDKDDQNNNKINLDFVSGSHDKNIKFWE